MRTTLAFLCGLALLPNPALADLQSFDNSPDAAAEATLLQSVSQNPEQRYQGVLILHTAEELQTILLRADRDAKRLNYQSGQPVALVLQGDEIALFVRNHYRENKALVDLAARLDAFNVVDLKVCERWMSAHQVHSSDLPPFLDAVADGPAEIQRLQLQGYASF